MGIVYQYLTCMKRYVLYQDGGKEILSTVLANPLAQTLDLLPQVKTGL
jgi:hypothetical protein